MTENSNSKPIRTSRDEVIIDGVDVSGCDFLAKEDDYCSYSGEYRAYKGECGCSEEEMCKDHPNCFYKKTLKQLARKTQECEELKKDRINIIKEDAKDYRKLQQAEQKLKRIKQVCEDYCEQMCLCDSRETCKDCINTEILQIIDKVK